MGEQRPATSAAISAAQAAAADLRRVATTRADRAAALASADAWLAAHADRKPLADQWDRWHRDLTRWATACARRTADGDAIARATQARRAKAEALQATPGRRGRPGRGRGGRGRTSGGAGGLRAAPEAAAHTHRDRVNELASLQRPARSVAKAQAAREARRAEAHAAHGRAALTEAAAETLEGDAKLLQAQLGEARRSYELSRSMLQLADHRARLTPGEPARSVAAPDHPGVHTSDALVLAQGGPGAQAGARPARSRVGRRPQARRGRQRPTRRDARRRRSPTRSTPRSASTPTTGASRPARAAWSRPHRRGRRCPLRWPRADLGDRRAEADAAGVARSRASSPRPPRPRRAPRAGPGRGRVRQAGGPRRRPRSPS
ncbi:MAG: hypothetical protein R3F43_29455 [bacterium]